MAYLENYLWPEGGYNLKDFGILAHKIAMMEYLLFMEIFHCDSFLRAEFRYLLTISLKEIRVFIKRM